ncbi:MAG: thioredoxin family protein, partial [Candidatus Puniceispirillales bacterium]
PQTPQQFGVRGIPTLLIFENGAVKAEKIGALPKSKLSEWVEESL